MFKRIIASMLVCLMVLPLMASCGGNKSDEGTVNLAIWHTDVEDLEETSNHQRYLKAAEKFVAENEGYTVKVVGSVKKEKIMTALASGSGPDIVKAQWQQAGAWGKEGIIADLTDFVNSDKEFDKDDIIPAAWDRSTYKGRIYSIPVTFNSSELYYNKDYLDKYGVEVPKTIGELKKIAVDLTEYDDAGNIVRAGYIPDHPWIDNVLWPVVFGADWINPETNEITFDTPEMKAAYQWQLDIYNTLGYEKIQTFKSSFGKGAQEPFLAGRLAMRFSGEKMPDDVALHSPDLNYGVAYIPYPDGKPELEGSMFCTITALMLNNNSKNSKEDGWKLLSYVTGKEVIGELAKGMNNQGAMMCRVSALESLQNMDTVLPIKKDVAKLMQNPNVKGFPMLTYVDQYLAVVADEIGAVFQDPANNSLDDAMKNVQTEVQAIADKNPIND